MLFCGRRRFRCTLRWTLLIFSVIAFYIFYDSKKNSKTDVKIGLELSISTNFSESIRLKWQEIAAPNPKAATLAFHKSCTQRDRDINLPGQPLVLLMTYNRYDQLNISLWNLICEVGISRSRLVVSSQIDIPSSSNDINIPSINKMRQESERITSLYGVQLILQPRILDAERPDTNRMSTLTRHYANLFEYAFESLHESYVVIMEDDLRAAPDLGRYFAGMTSAMEVDSSIFCVSAWNDNSYPALAADESHFLRGEHFMALGWMTSAKHYRQHIRNSFESSQNFLFDWDKPFTEAMKFFKVPRPGMQDAKDPWFECVFPHVTRTHHTKLKNHATYSTSDHMQNDYFDNMALAKTLGPFDYSAVVGPAYEMRLQQFITSATAIITSLDQIYEFHQAKLVLLCKECAESRYTRNRNRAWISLFEELHIFGYGFVDGTIRGVHHGTVFFTIATNSILVVAGDSPYFPMSSLLEPSKSLNNATKSALFEFNKEKLVIGERGVSCSTACKSAHLTCYEQYLAYVNQCKMLTSVFGLCKKCLPDANHGGPFLHFADELTNQNGEMAEDTCETTLLRHLNCDATDGRFQRICLCS